ncbi:MAG: dihydrodipicolinate synthase family protein [Acidobacteriota bacterium]
MSSPWKGVYPAATTQFHEDESLDLEGTAQHVETLLDAGVDGLVMLGTLGEGTSLQHEEKLAVLETTVKTSAGRVPVLAGIAEPTTAGAITLTRQADELGVDGVMVLPGLTYRSDHRETVTHYRRVAEDGGLPVMVYNNPVSYGVDVTPEALRELADVEGIVAVKESSEDVRRITDIRNVVGDRYQLFCGVDDIALECLAAGADGWLAGLVDAFPDETVHLYRLMADARLDEARALYRWFMPLLHLDTNPRLVQNIKLAMVERGWGRDTVRAPRLPLAEPERSEVLAVIREALANRPELPKSS